MCIRTVLPEECGEVSSLINSPHSENLLLPRSKKYVRKNCQKHLVKVADNNEIVGTIGFKLWPQKTTEVIAFVVKQEWRGQGIGEDLLRHLIQIIEEGEYNRKVWALTTFVGTFKKCGFTNTDISDFPEKVRNDCLKCKKYRSGMQGSILECGETALILRINNQCSFKRS